MLNHDKGDFFRGSLRFCEGRTHSPKPPASHPSTAVDTSPGSGIGLAAVQPILAILLMGLLLPAAAQENNPPTITQVQPPGLVGSRIQRPITITNQQEVSFDVLENSENVATITAIDQDPGDSITSYSLGGDYTHLYEITSAGVLTFKTPPDYENLPAGGMLIDRLPVFPVTVTVTSGAGGRELTDSINLQPKIRDQSGADEELSPPRNVMVTPLSGNRLLITWMLPAKTGPGITDYTIEYAASDTTSTTSAPDDQNFYILSGLSPDTKYNIRIRAVFIVSAEGTANNRGTWSSLISGSTSSSTAPSKPAAPTLTAGSGQLTAEWAAPTNTGGSAITDYDLRYREKPASPDEYDIWTEILGSSDSTATSATITGLTNGTEYEVQVRAENTNGAGLWSAAATGTPIVTAESLTYTAAPTTLTVGTAITALTATATNFTGTVGYSVTTGSLPAGLGINASTGEITGAPTAASTSTTMVTVTATAGTGTDMQTATANITFPAVGKGTLATPTNLALKSNTQRKTGFTVSWTAVTKATGYTVTATPSDGTVMVSGTEATFTGLTAGTTYTVSVVATGNTDNYENSMPATLSQVTATNAAPSITDITNKTATFGTNLLVDVDATDTNPEDTLQYQASSSAMAVATVTPTSLTDLGANSQVTVTPVAVGTATITVTVSDGTASPTDTFVVTVGKATLATPTNLALKPNTQRKTGFTVSWTAVTNATGYTATASASGETDVTVTLSTAPANPEAAFTGLTVGTDYTVRVVAKGNANYNDSTAATLSQPTATNMAPSITDITNKTATFGTNLLVDVDATDTNPEDTLQYQASSGDETVATVAPTSLTDLGTNSQITVTPVAAGTATITVTVSDGTASPTDTFVVTVGKATLATPTNLALKPNTQRKTGFTVSWTAVTNATGYTATASASGETDVTVTLSTAPANPEAAFTGLTVGTDYTVRVVAKGNANYNDSTAATLSQPTATNMAPSITDITNKTATFGTNLLVDVDATDTNPEDTLQYQASSGDETVATVAPTSLTDLGTNSQITVTPVAAGTATITVTVSDGTASPTDTFVVTVGKATLATPTNLALKPNTQRKTGFTVSWTAVTNATGYTATASASGETDVTVTLSTAPANPEAAFTGLTVGTDYTVRVVAKGNANYNDSTAATLSQPTATNMAPSITDITNKAATFDTNLMVDVDATDTNPEDTLQYQASSGDETVATVAPTSLTDLGTNSQITVTPVAAGTATITVTVSDGTASPTDTFVVTVSRAQLGTPVVTVSAQDGELTATWPDVPNAASYEVEYKEGTSDTWLNNDDDTSPAEIDSLTNGTEYDVRVRAKAAAASTTYADSAWSEVKKGTPVVVDVAPSFGSETIPAQTWTVGTNVDLTLPLATGGNGTISYELTPALPSGVTLNSSTRKITGAPTAVASAATYTWRALDSDSNTANSDTAALTFSVKVGKGTLATPTDLALKANTQRKTSFTVSWTAVTNATGYTATASASGETDVTVTLSTAHANPEAAFTGLTVGTDYMVRVVAKGNANYNDSTAATLDQATAANAAPSITDITNKTATFGTNLLVDVDATDTNPEDTLQYQASSGDTAVATVSPTSLTDLGTNSQITVTPVAAGTATITVTVSDGTASPTDTFVVTVSRAQLGTPVVTVSAQDGELTVTWPDVPNAASYEVEYKESTSDTWLNNDDDTSPAEIDSLTNGTEYDVRVRAKAASASTTYADSAWSEVKKGTPVVVDVAPSFGSETIPAQTWTVGTNVDLTLPLATGGNGTISYELTPALPSGVTLNSSTRVVSGAPTAVASAATYTWRAKDSDSNTANTDTAALTFSVTVNKATLVAPTGLDVKANSKTRTGFTVTWTAVANATGYTATARTSGQPDKTVTLLTAPTNPEAVFTDLEMNTTYTVTVVATGNANYTDSDASDGLSVTILANQVPTVGTTIPDQEAVVGLSFSYTFPSTSFSDADGDDLTYTATKADDTALPSWLTFTNSSSTPRNFAGTPQSGDTGRLSVKVTASDGTASISDTFDIVVSADTAPAFTGGTTIPDQTWTVDTQITALTLPAATGGNGTVSYELTPSLPTGVSLNETTRVVSGTPTMAAAQATYTWRAKDSDSNTANTDTAALTFALTVNKATLAKPTNLEATSETRDRVHGDL